jgi:hypothetical protein
MRNEELGIRNATHPLTSIRNSEFGISTHPDPSSGFALLRMTSFCFRTRMACGGGAWHPDSARIGVPGILTGSVTTEGLLSVGSASLQCGRHDKKPYGRTI